MEGLPLRGGASHDEVGQDHSHWVCGRLPALVSGATARAGCRLRKGRLYDYRQLRSVL